MASTLKFMGPKGHETLEWNPAAALDEHDPEAIAILEEVRKVCDGLAGQGRPLFRTDPSDITQAEQITAFDPRAKEIIVGLPLRGG